MVVTGTAASGRYIKSHSDREKQGRTTYQACLQKKVPSMMNAVSQQIACLKLFLACKGTDAFKAFTKAKRISHAKKAHPKRCIRDACLDSLCCRITTDSSLLSWVKTLIATPRIYAAVWC